jgi:hypothetical protein
MSAPRVAALVALFAAAVGLCACAWLVALHGGLAAPVPALCGGAGACAEALASPWSSLPPAHWAPASWPRMPVAVLGLLHFAALAAGLLVQGRPWFAQAVAGAVGSALYLALSLGSLEVPCGACLTVHGASAAVLGAGLWLRRTPDTGRGRRRGARLAALVAALTAAAAAHFATPDLGTLLARHRGAVAVQVDAELLFFGNATCPSCRAFERFLEATIVPAGAGDLHVERRELPLPGQPVTDPQAQRLARSLGVTSVPAVFLHGRAVPREALLRADFWRAALRES